MIEYTNQTNIKASELFVGLFIRIFDYSSNQIILVEILDFLDEGVAPNWIGIVWCWPTTKSSRASEVYMMRKDDIVSILIDPRGSAVVSSRVKDWEVRS